MYLKPTKLQTKGHVLKPEAKCRGRDGQDKRQGGQSDWRCGHGRVHSPWALPGPGMEPALEAPAAFQGTLRLHLQGEARAGQRA